MRKTLIMTVASTAVLAVAPGAALAQHHHRGKHHRGHHRAHTERFGAPMSGSGTTSPSEDNAGTVASFSGGVLTLKLNDGSTVSGKATNDTEMECQSTQKEEMARDDGGRGDDNSGDGDHGDSSGQNQTAGQDQNEANENENENENGQACDSSMLTPGTVVREAELRVSSGGATWKKLELQK